MGWRTVDHNGAHVLLAVEMDHGFPTHGRTPESQTPEGFFMLTNMMNCLRLRAPPSAPLSIIHFYRQVDMSGHVLTVAIPIVLVHFCSNASGKLEITLPIWSKILRSF